MFDNTEILIGKKMSIIGHFNEPVVIEESVLKGSGFEIRVRLADGILAETFLSEEEFYELLNSIEKNEEAISFSNPNEFRLIISSSHIRLTDNVYRIDEIDLESFEEYEESTGTALSRSVANFSSIDDDNVDAEEGGLTPSYLEEYFLEAARMLGLGVERHDNRLWKLKRFPKGFLSDCFAAMQRYGKLKKTSVKFTFDKDHLDDYAHFDVELVRPGSYLYEIVNDRVTEKLSELYGGIAVFIDAASESPYRLYFFEMCIIGNTPRKKGIPIYGELIAVREDPGRYTNREGRLSIVKPDVLNDLVSCSSYRGEPVNLEYSSAIDFVKTGYQAEKRIDISKKRKKYIDTVKRHLIESFAVRIEREQNRIEDIKVRMLKAVGDFDMAVRAAEMDIKDLKRKRDERLKNFERLGVARPAPLKRIGTALVLPHEKLDLKGSDDLSFYEPEANLAFKKAAEDIVIAFEEAGGRKIEKVGDQEIGFDIKSTGPVDPRTGRCDVRRIMASGRERVEPIVMTFNEWFRAKRLGKSYWLYVVWDPLNSANSEPITVRDPAEVFKHVNKRNDKYRVVVIPAKAVEKYS